MSTLPKIIAVDFDGTLFENAWPDVGAAIEKNINKLKAEQADGAKVILWTNRVGGALDKAVNFCKEHGIHLDAVNENLPEIVQGFGTDCRKIFANEYWDDHAVWMSKQDIGEFSDGFHTFNSLYHLSKFELPGTRYIDTIYESGHVRYEYYGIGITHTGTIFTTLSDNTISDSSPFYEDLTIDEAVNRLEKGVGTTVFWIFWIIGTGVIVFKFYERENEWLE